MTDVALVRFCRRCGSPMRKVAIREGFDRVTGQPNTDFELRCVHWAPPRFLRSYEPHDRYWVGDGKAYADWTS